MDTNSDYIVVLTNLPDRHTAQAMAQHLLELRLAACVNVLSPCLSIYHWQEKIETAEEVPVLIKSRSSDFDAIEKAIRAKHPYEVPEIISLPITMGYSGYLNWIQTATNRSNNQQNSSLQ